MLARKIRIKSLHKDYVSCYNYFYNPYVIVTDGIVNLNMVLPDQPYLTHILNFGIAQLSRYKNVGV